LRNGSVANLFQLLLPVAERSRAFWVGNFEYEPQHAGFVSSPFKGGFLLDTSITGNSNLGHEFRYDCRKDGVIGRALQPDERLDLIEYLKVLGDSSMERQLSSIEPRVWNAGP
jgi:hypothetical protein